MINPFSLNGKRVLVTGASSGIGKSVAELCANLDANVIVTGRNEERLSQTLCQLDTNDAQSHQIVVADLSTDEGICNLISHIDESLDGVVYSAGVNDKYLLKFIKRENVNYMFNTNVFAPILLSKELQKKKKINKGASIVFISSIASIYATISNALYASTKGAINSLIRTLALELSSNRIRVNGIMPGMVKTSMIDAYGLSEDQMKEVIKSYPLGRLGTPQDIANAVAFLLSDASSWITGVNIIVDGGVTLR